jgi:hypothetical protein
MATRKKINLASVAAIGAAFVNGNDGRHAELEQATRGRLRSLGLIEYPERGHVRARDILFLD